jgi:hypothetical protein
LQIIGRHSLITWWIGRVKFEQITENLGRFFAALIPFDLHGRGHNALLNACKFISQRSQEAGFQQSLILNKSRAIEPMISLFALCL